MSDTEPDFQINNDEFSRIFDQYRARIEEITRQTEHGLQSVRAAAAESPSPDSEAPPQNQTTTLPDTQPLPQHTGQISISPPATESEKTLKEARRQAKKIVEEAEERAKKEAKKKTQAQIDKLLSGAQQQAEELVTQTRNIVSQERDAAIEATKTHMERILSDITEQARRDTSQKSSEAINRAREQTEKMMSDVAASALEINHLIKETIERMRQNINEIETRLQDESSGLSRAITDTQLKIEQITSAVQTEDNAAANPTEHETPSAGRRLMIHVAGDRSNGKNGTEPLFLGQVEVRAESTSLDYSYFKNLKKYLVKVPGIKHLQESASEKDFSAVFDMTEPLPLLELLRRMPLIDQVTSETDKDISVEFKPPA